MTASAHRYTCAQLSTCQSRATPCHGCPPPRTRSLTPEPLLLNTERLHRVDASQLPQGAGVCLGHCRTDLDRTPSQGCTGDCDQGRRCTCTPDTKCAQHQHQGALFAKVLLGYGAVLFLAALATWQWLSR